MSGYVLDAGFESVSPEVSTSSRADRGSLAFALSVWAVIAAPSWYALAHFI